MGEAAIDFCIPTSAGVTVRDTPSSPTHRQFPPVQNGANDGAASGALGGCIGPGP